MISELPSHRFHLTENVYVFACQELMGKKFPLDFQKTTTPDLPEFLARYSRLGETSHTPLPRNKFRKGPETISRLDLALCCCKRLKHWAPDFQLAFELSHFFRILFCGPSWYMEWHILRYGPVHDFGESCPTLGRAPSFRLALLRLD